MNQDVIVVVVVVVVANGGLVPFMRETGSESHAVHCRSLKHKLSTKNLLKRMQIIHTTNCSTWESSVTKFRPRTWNKM